MDKLTVIDFFCGAGGFSEGFRQAGYEIKQGYDNWLPAIETFNHNFDTSSEIKNILDFKDSIEEIELLPDTDVIIGSPPCVSFSSSNLSGKADKASGVLLTKIFLRIVAVKKFQKGSKLKAWYMENVTNSRNYLADYYTFKDLGLKEWAKKNKLSPEKKAIILKDNQPLINSADYGSYQARKRAISGEIISRKRLIIPEKKYSEKPNGELKKWKELGNLLSKLPSPNSNENNIIHIDPIYSDIRLSTSDISDHFYDSGLYRSEWRQSKFLKINHPYMGKMSFPENLEKPSRTITATKTNVSRETIIYKSEYTRNGNGEYRSPTIREASCIMGFPFTYQFLGSENTKWRLVGNAVCPSVSRAFAQQLKKELNFDLKNDLVIKKKPNLIGVNNLNTFDEKSFDNQPKRIKNSRCRRHPFKDGNLTVTLSNYDIEKNSKTKRKWFTSIQYGNGEGFPIQKVNNHFYKAIEPVIANYKEGRNFIEIINNGFSEKIAKWNKMQMMYEQQYSMNNYLEPTELVEEIENIIKRFDIEESLFKQEGKIIFKNKTVVPLKQLFALYAVNKVSSIASKR